MVAAFHLHSLGHRIKYRNSELGNNNQQFLSTTPHAAELSLLNHFYFESFSSHIILVYVYLYIFVKLAIFIPFLLSSTVVFFLQCMLNILRYEKIF